MQKFDVHSFVVVRIKVEGVEAESAEAAIKAVENDSDLQHRMAQRVQQYREGEEISAIEMDEGALPVSYLVDVVGDGDFGNSRSFDVAKNGNLIEIGKEPGRQMPVSVFQRAALSSFNDDALATLVQRSTEQYYLFENMSHNHGECLPLLLAKEIGDVPADQIDQACSRIDAMIDKLTLARNSVAALSDKLSDVHSAAIYDPAEKRIGAPVIIEGEEVGSIVRTYSPGRGITGLWRDACFMIRHTVVARGLPQIMDYIRTSFGASPEIIIPIHDGYHAIYGPDGAPSARVLVNDDGFHLRVFDPHLSEKHASLELALLAAGVSGAVASEYARLNG